MKHLIAQRGKSYSMSVIVRWLVFIRACRWLQLSNKVLGTVLSHTVALRYLDSVPLTFTIQCMKLDAHNFAVTPIGGFGLEHMILYKTKELGYQIGHVSSLWIRQIHWKSYLLVLNRFGKVYIHVQYSLRIKPCMYSDRDYHVGEIVLRYLHSQPGSSLRYRTLSGVAGFNCHSRGEGVTG